MKPRSKSSTELPIHHFQQQQEWTAWLNENHTSSPGVWLQLAKKGADVSSVSYEEAIEIALCFGWIDGQKQAHSDQFWLQKFTRRSDKSVWSKINRDKALALIKAKKLSVRSSMGDGMLRMTHPAKQPYQTIFNLRWMAMRELKRSSERSTVEVGTLFCSGFKLPRKPKRARSGFHSSF
jgi:hypothetical protein